MWILVENFLIMALSGYLIQILIWWAICCGNLAQISRDTHVSNFFFFFFRLCIVACNVQYWHFLISFFRCFLHKFHTSCFLLNPYVRNFKCHILMCLFLIFLLLDVLLQNVAAVQCAS